MELQIIVLLVLLSFFIKGFKYKVSNVLSCGQWGYIGDSYDARKCEILGLYNQSRGVHSCGVYVDGYIHKGVNELKLWMDYVVAHPLPRVLESGNNVFLGHARQASSGFVHDWNHQHPFHVGNLIGQQNGTIKNDTLLGKKYGISYKDWNVDTELLYMIMNEHGYDVLEEYSGFAALMWVREDTPNELFVFRGVSPHVLNDDKWYEERPLWYLKEENGMYFSSMESSLKFIRSNPDHEIDKVPYNQVIRLYLNEDNEVQWEVVKKVNRDLSKVLVYQYESYNRHAHVGNVDTRTEGMKVLGTGARISTTTTLPNTVGTGKGKNNTGLKQASFNEKFSEMTINPEKALGMKLLYANGRYFCGNKILHGVVNVTDEGIVVNKHTKNDAEVHILYFIAGIMLKDRETWQKFCRNPWKDSGDKSFKKHKHFFRKFAFTSFDTPDWVIEMSIFAKYPIKVMPYNCNNTELCEMWYYEGKPANELIINPLHSTITYYYLDGKLHGRLKRIDGVEVEEITRTFGIQQHFDTDYSLRNPDQNDSCSVGDLFVDKCIQDIEDVPFTEMEAETVHIRPLFPVVWDIVYKSTLQFFMEFGPKQLLVLHYYIESIMNKDNPTRFTDKEVKEFLIAYVEEAIKNKRSIREEVEDPTRGSFEMLTALVDEEDSEISNKFFVIRNLYQDEMISGFQREMEMLDEEENLRKMPDYSFNPKDEHVEDEVDEEEDEEKLYILTTASEEIVSCCQTLNGVEQDLESYSEEKDFMRLKNIVSTSNNALSNNLREFMKDVLSEEESKRLVNKI